MKKVTTRPPSFPKVEFDKPLTARDQEKWQVLCGDADHWRAGLFMPEHSSSREVLELEKHDCPELFLLLWGKVTLVLSTGNGATRELKLEPGKPVLVDAPHSGYCPDGPMTGAAFVIERDSFDTEYRPVGEW